MQQVTAQTRQARAAVTALFFTNGALMAGMVPRYPAIKDVFELSGSTYGLTVALFPLGGMCGGAITAWAIRKWGSARVAASGTAILGVLFALAGFLVSFSEAGWLGIGIGYAAFAASFFACGFCDANVDVGQNAHGLRVQKRYGRSIINSFHAAWSGGVVAGGLLASVAIAVGLPIGWHMLLAGGLFALLGQVALRYTLPGPEGQNAEEEANAAAVHTIRISPILALAALIFLSIAGALVEDNAQAWATLYMRDFLGISAALAGSAYVAAFAAQLIGRMVGDRMIDNWGPRTVIGLGGLLITVGMFASMLFPSAFTTVTGLALAGFGSATIVPIAMNAADDIPGLRPGTGLAVLAWLMRVAFLASPPLIGKIVDIFGVRVSLWALPFAGLAVIASSFVLAAQSKQRI